jgi:hypothetical protein
MLSRLEMQGRAIAPERHRSQGMQRACGDYGGVGRPNLHRGRSLKKAAIAVLAKQGQPC